MKKYELLQEDKVCYIGRTFIRIRACKDFTTFDGEVIRKGDKGGYIENERNLSQEGTCWIFEHGKVMDNATVKDNAIVKYGDLKDNAVIKDNAELYGYATVKDNAVVGGNSFISGVLVDGDKTISGDFVVFNKTLLAKALENNNIQTL